MKHIIFGNKKSIGEQIKDFVNFNSKRVSLKDIFLCANLDLL